MNFTAKAKKSKEFNLSFTVYLIVFLTIFVLIFILRITTLNL